MNLFVTTFIICCFMLDLGVQKEVKFSISSSMELSSMEIIRLSKSSNDQSDGNEKRDYTFLPRTTNGLYISQKISASSVPKHTNTYYNYKQKTTIRSSKRKLLRSPKTFGTRKDSGTTNSITKYKTANEAAYFSSYNTDSNSKSSREVNYRTKLLRNRSNFNQLLNKFHGLSYNKGKVVTKRRVGYARRIPETRVLNSKTDFNSELSLANSIYSSNKYNYTYEMNSEVLRTNFTESTITKVFTEDSDSNNFSYPTVTSYDITLNSSSYKYNNDKTSVGDISIDTLVLSSTVDTNSVSNSRLSKTAVAAIVAGINGFIGFAGAAIFTCMKYNYLRNNEERQPLIR